MGACRCPSSISRTGASTTASTTPLLAAHRVYVEPFDKSVDFDLHIYDENGNLISEDVTLAAEAYCNVTPRWTGPFRLIVNSARGTAGFRILVHE